MPKGYPNSGIRKPPQGNATYRLSAEDRTVLGIMAALGRWSITRLAREFGVSRKTVLVCRERWEQSATR